MTVKCFFCGGPVNPHDLGTWKQVTGWVGGARKDSMTMREDSGEYAHDHCVNKARMGQAVDQPDMFSDAPSAPRPAADPVWVIDVDREKAKELFDGD